MVGLSDTVTASWKQGHYDMARTLPGRPVERKARGLRHSHVFPDYLTFPG